MNSFEISSYQTDLDTFDIVEEQTGEVLKGNIKGFHSMVDLTEKLVQFAKNWVEVVKLIKNRDMDDVLPLIMAIGITKTGHLTLEANVIHSLKTALEKYAERAEKLGRIDGRNEAVIKYVNSGKSHRIPFI